MKRTILALSLGVFVSSAHAWGVPTADAVAAILSMENEAARAADAAKEIAELKRQYDVLKQQLEAMRGNYGYGAKLLYESIEGTKIVPGSWQAVVADQAQGKYGSNLARAEALLNTLPKEEAGKTTQRGQTYTLSSNAVRSSMAAADLLYTEAHTHLLAIDKLSQEVDKTENTKAAADLSNRIAVERALLDTANAKMAAINLNLQANAVNGQNQAAAVSHSFYQWNEAAK